MKKIKKSSNTENKKVKNAKEVSYGGIKFKSRLELYCYKKLKESGIEFRYEPEAYILFVGSKPNLVKFYDPDKNTKRLKLNTTKIINVTYTPDFVGSNWVIETKGLKSSTYSIKMKMFREYLENTGNEWVILEPHNQVQIDEAIKLIKQLTISN